MTGTPTFLLQLLAERRFYTPDLERLQRDASLLSSFDVEPIYTLGYPSRKVEWALNRALFFHGGWRPRSVQCSAGSCALGGRNQPLTNSNG